jgi:hypothetical protein
MLRQYRIESIASVFAIVDANRLSSKDGDSTCKVRTYLKSVGGSYKNLTRVKAGNCSVHLSGLVLHTAAVMGIR